MLKTCDWQHLWQRMFTCFFWCCFFCQPQRGEESPKGDTHDIAQFITPSEGHLHENSVSRNALTGTLLQFCFARVDARAYVRIWHRCTTVHKYILWCVCMGVLQCICISSTVVLTSHMYEHSTLAFYSTYRELYDYLFITNEYSAYTTCTEYLSTTHHTTFRYLGNLALFDSYPLASHQRALSCWGVDVRCCCWQNGDYLNSQNPADTRFPV